MPYLDLTQTFSNKTLAFAGDPKPLIKQVAFLKKGRFNDYIIKTGMHIGTHIDAPFHMLMQGKKISEIRVDRFFGPGVIINAQKEKQIHHSLLNRVKINAGEIVLVYTGWAKNFTKKKYFKDFPQVEKKFAEQLVKRKVKMLGLDTPSPDLSPFLIHKILLSHEILILENLTNLAKLLNKRKFEIIALPVKYQTEAGPARVVAKY